MRPSVVIVVVPAPGPSRTTTLPLVQPEKSFAFGALAGRIRCTLQFRNPGLDVFQRRGPAGVIQDTVGGAHAARRRGGLVDHHFEKRRDGCPRSLLKPSQGLRESLPSRVSVFVLALFRLGNPPRGDRRNTDGEPRPFLNWAAAGEPGLAAPVGQLSSKPCLYA